MICCLPKRCFLYPIFHEIEAYDVIKARQAISEKAEGIIKFYKEGSFSKLVGPVRRTSFARLAFGPHAGVWGSQEISYFIDHLEHAHLIDEEQKKSLEKLTGATMKHVTLEGSIGLLQMMALALAFVVAQTSLKEGFTGVDEISS